MSARLRSSRVSMTSRMMPASRTETKTGSKRRRNVLRLISGRKEQLDWMLWRNSDNDLPLDQTIATCTCGACGNLRVPCISPPRSCLYLYLLTMSALSDSFSFCQHNYHKYVVTSLISSIRSTYPCTSFFHQLCVDYVWSRTPGKAVQFLFVGAPSLLNGVFIIRK